MCSSCATFPKPSLSLEISTDGSFSYNGKPSARGGWGVAIVLSDSVIGHQVRGEIRAPLDVKCDCCKRSSCRAELRAVEGALYFIHGMCHLGHEPKLCHKFVSKPSVDGWVSAVIRSDLQSGVDGLNGKSTPNKHKDLWKLINGCKGCLLNNGCHLQFHHVHAHRGDEQNELADRLAKIAADERPGMYSAKCLKCPLEFHRREDLPEHFKNVHFLRYPEEEPDLANYAEKTEDEKVVICSICSKRLKTLCGLRDHVRDKHGIKCKKTGDEKVAICPVCSKRFKALCGLRDHVRDKHGIKCKKAGDGKVAICSVCSKRLRTPCGLRDHLRDKHGITDDEKVAICPT